MNAEQIKTLIHQNDIEIQNIYKEIFIKNIEDYKKIKQICLKKNYFKIFLDNEIE